MQELAVVNRHRRSVPAYRPCPAAVWRCPPTHGQIALREEPQDHGQTHKNLLSRQLSRNLSRHLVEHRILAPAELLSAPTAIDA
jgi:hypothetical protein